MKKTTTILAAALAGTLLCLAGSPAYAHGRDHDDDRWEHRHDRGWKHGHDRYYYYDRGPVVYAPTYYAPPPPPVVYRPAPVYYGGYRPEPAITIGVGIPPIVIPLR